jgi:hypothetical protein
MEANSTQQTEPEITSGFRRKSNIVEPFLRLQNKATSWSSKSESDLTKLGRGEEKSECCSPSVVSNTHAEAECVASEMQNSSLGCLENRCKSTTQRRSVSERVSLVSDASPHCCSHGVSKSKRRSSSSALPECVTAHTDSSHHHDHRLRKATPKKNITNPVDVCNGYAVPLPVVKPKSGPTEYGRTATNEDGIKGKVSSPGNSSVSDDKDIGVINKYSNICHCIGKQKFIEGHYKATYLCGFRVGGKNEGASACEQTAQEVEHVEKAKPTNASSLTTTDNRSPQSTDKETISSTRSKYGSLPTSSSRVSFINSSEDSASHIYSNLVATDFLVQKDSAMNKEDENLYGNCTCSAVEDIMSVEDEHEISHHMRRLSRASSTSSCAIRSTGKRTRDSVPARLSEICIRVLIKSVSRLVRGVQLVISQHPVLQSLLPFLVYLMNASSTQYLNHAGW